VPKRSGDDLSQCESPSFEFSARVERSGRGRGTQDRAKAWSLEQGALVERRTVGGRHRAEQPVVAPVVGGEIIYSAAHDPGHIAPAAEGSGLRKCVDLAR